MQELRMRMPLAPVDLFARYMTTAPDSHTRTLDPKHIILAAERFMTKPILPKLKTGHNVTFFNEAGKWDIRTQDSLQKLSSGLKVDKVESEISSIPDMWARPMLFEMALLNPEHVLHKRILGEWRGLLAMLSLKAVLQLNDLTAIPITLPQLAHRGNGDDTGLPAEAQRDFLLTLTKLLPKASLASDTSWRFLY